MRAIGRRRCCHCHLQFRRNHRVKGHGHCGQSQWLQGDRRYRRNGKLACKELGCRAIRRRCGGGRTAESCSAQFHPCRAVNTASPKRPAASRTRMGSGQLCALPSRRKAGRAARRRSIGPHCLIFICPMFSHNRAAGYPKDTRQFSLSKNPCFLEIFRRYVNRWGRDKPQIIGLCRRESLRHDFYAWQNRRLFLKLEKFRIPKQTRIAIEP